MKTIFIILMIELSGLASATTYYVSSSSGNDANSGTSSLTAWQTIAKVNSQTFLPGDSILFRRGDIWNESLVPSSSGTAGSPIAFDAYGTGPAPNFTGYYAVPSAWVLVTGNAWKVALPASYSTVNFCLFGSVWGQKVAASTANLKGQWDFYFANGNLYVFSVGSPASYYNTAIVPMGLSNVPVINVNGKSWLTFQHFLVNWFDQYGMYVQGASDHLVFANMEADSMIPEGTQPLGFYVNESAPGPSDIKIYNAEAHLNYDGFRFDGAATAITMVNDKAYGSRDGALVDNTAAVTYSYCHFYASSLAVGSSTDVLWTSGNGPAAGAGNVPPDTAPAVQAWRRYAGRVSLTVDDAGMTAGADTYYANTVLPIADAAGVQVGAAITVGYPLAQTLISEFQGWINAGRDVTAHSMSHTYYTNTDALDIQYTGSGSAAALSISNKTLTITVTGAADSVSYNLAQGQPRGTISGLRQALLATGKFTATERTPCQGPYGTGCSAYTEGALLTQDLADVAGQDVKGAIYAMQLDVTRFTTDELTLSRQWMTANLTGLPASPVYVYPGGYETATMQGIAASGGYAGARGALKEDLGVKDTYASGFDVQNITSFGMNPTWQGLQPAALQQKIQALVWKQMVWGVPWGIFWHANELSLTEITNLVQDLKNSGATIQTNTGLVNWLVSGTQETGTAGNYYYKSPALNMTVDFRPTATSPVVDAGQNLGAAYAIDINGVNQSSYGSAWEIGAHAYIPTSMYGESNPPAGLKFTIGGAAQTGTAQLPQRSVDPNEINPPGGIFDVVKNANGTDYAATFAGLQQAICDWVAAPDQWWLVKVPHGTLVQAGTAVTCTQTGTTSYRALTLLTKIVGGTVPTKFIVFDSDTPAAADRTVCSRGITDGVGIGRQPPTGDIATWWTGGNNGCSNDIGNMWTLEGNWTPGNVGQLIQAGQWDTTTNLGPSHVIFKNVEMRPLPSIAASLFLVNTNIGDAFASPTLLSQMPSHIHFVNIYGHGDAKDWCQSGNPLGLTSCTPASYGLGGPGSNKISTALKLSDCQYCSVTFSYFDYIISQGAENHVIGISRSNGPVTIANNWISSGSMAFITGGIASTDPLYSIFDLLVHSNRLTNPISWVGANYGAAQKLTLKNRLELKACQRCLLEGNIAEWQDVSGAQDGQCFGVNPRSCSASQQCDNYQVADQDITIRNNICRHALVGISDAGTSSYPSNGGGTTAPLDRITMVNNLFYDIGSAFFDQNKNVSFPFAFRTSIGDPSFICSGTNAAGVQTFTCDGSVVGLKQTQVRPGDSVVITNCSTANWNYPPVSTDVWLMQKGTPAITGTTPGGLTVVVANPNATGATATGCILQRQGSPFHQVIQHNTIVMQSDAYPTTHASGSKNLTGTTNSIAGGLATVSVSGTPTVVPGVGKINIVGANVAAYNCTLCLVTATTSSTVTYQTASGNSGPDTLTTGSMQQPPNNAAVYNGNSTVNIYTDTGCGGAGPNNTVTVSAWSRSNNIVNATVSSVTGWGPASGIVSPQILVESVGNGSASGLFYYQGQAGGNTLTFSQNGANETGATFGTLAQMGTCPGQSFSVANTFKNNLVVVDQGTAPSCPSTSSTGWAGWNTSGNGPLEGCRAGFSNSNCAENHLDALTSVATYTDFPGRCPTNYTEMGGVNAGVNPPVTLTFPSTTVCSGASATAACVGMQSMMNGVAFDNNDADYHNYQLVPSSVYKAGNANAADDGKDLGADIAAIDRAMQ